MRWIQLPDERMHERIPDTKHGKPMWRLKPSIGDLELETSNITDKPPLLVTKGSCLVHEV